MLKSINEKFSVTDFGLWLTEKICFVKAKLVRLKQNLFSLFAFFFLTNATNFRSEENKRKEFNEKPLENNFNYDFTEISNHTQKDIETFKELKKNEDRDNFGSYLDSMIEQKSKQTPKFIDKSEDEVELIANKHETNTYIYKDADTENTSLVQRDIHKIEENSTEDFQSFSQNRNELEITEDLLNKQEEKCKTDKSRIRSVEEVIEDDNETHRNSSSKYTVPDVELVENLKPNQAFAKAAIDKNDNPDSGTKFTVKNGERKESFQIEKASKEVLGTDSGKPYQDMLQEESNTNPDQVKIMSCKKLKIETNKKQMRINNQDNLRTEAKECNKVFKKSKSDIEIVDDKIALSHKNDDAISDKESKNKELKISKDIVKKDKAKNEMEHEKSVKKSNEGSHNSANTKDFDNQKSLKICNSIRCVESSTDTKIKKEVSLDSKEINSTKIGLISDKNNKEITKKIQGSASSSILDSGKFYFNIKYGCLNYKKLHFTPFENHFVASEILLPSSHF